jgi:hypothetical protein
MPLLGSPRFAEATLFHLSSMAKAGEMRFDKDNQPTAVCIACGHVRWRHTFDFVHRIVCTVAKCSCIQHSAVNFAVAEYFGDPAK